jgi:hypothetical protein
LDYVAVNIAAVWAMLLGVGSSLALVDPYLLLIPIVAIVFAIVALRQIQNSNGTQTGGWLAWGGMALAVFFASFVLSRMAAQARQDARDRQAIVNVVAALSNDVKAGNFDSAYQHFSPPFQARVNMDRFKGQMHLVQDSALYGKLQSIQSNNVVQFSDAVGADDIRAAQTRLIITFDKAPAPITPDAVLRRDRGRWSLDDIPSLFPAENPQQQQQRRQ